LHSEGRFAWHFAENAETSQKAVDYFEQAIENDPSFAKAYAALASVYSVWIPGMAQGPRDRMPKAREFAMKALAQLENVSVGCDIKIDLEILKQEQKYMQ
jgi:tetratricopeptide (TPR) repeat protein